MVDQYVRFIGLFQNVIYSSPFLSEGKLYKSEKHSKIFCCNCGIDWGVIMNFNSVDIPVVKILNFKFKMRGVISTYKKWKDFPFDIIEGDIFNLYDI